MKFSVVIPARFASSRLPGKPLLDIAGKPLIQHVYECATKSNAERVVIATDDARIEAVAKSFGAQVCLTSTYHRSGTERIAEVIQTLRFNRDDIVVNLQGDEPMMPGELITQVANQLQEHSQASMSTLCARIHDDAELFNPNVVKVVRDNQGYALYFSRSPIPWDRNRFPPQMSQFAFHNLAVCEHSDYFKHIGLYAYTAGFVLQYINYPQSSLEQLESLEQLRGLQNGHKIYAGEARQDGGIGVDTEEDLEKVRQNFTSR
ncbi:MAG: 3-deoxy-manno-octulosonate cytidylyltransferase [Gammaproteobacteria bacterium]|nr:3-deoxy-manno-octulosonate cytidylyltransferase [Gammaproteobacteria bacterium]